MNEPREGDIVEVGSGRYVVGPDIDLDEEEVYDDSGRRITEADADAIAADVSARVGRPSLTAPGKRSPQVSFRVPVELRQRAEERAARENKSLSVLAREAFEAYLRAG